MDKINSMQYSLICHKENNRLIVFEKFKVSPPYYVLRFQTIFLN